MKKYTYKNKETGTKIQTNEPLKDPKFELVAEIKDGQIKNNQSRTK